MTDNSSLISTNEMPHAATSYTMGTITIITVAASTFGNITLIVIWVTKPKLRGHSVIFRYSLTACQLGFAMLCLVPVILNYMARKNLIGHMCDAQAYFFSMSFGICAWHMAFLVLNQYVWLSHQDFFAKYQTECATAMQLFFCWTMPAILFIPGFRNTEVSYYSKRLKCVFSTDTVASVIVLDALLSSALPGVIILTSLVLTYMHIRKQRAVVWSHHNLTEVSPSDYNRRASSVAAVRFQRDEVPVVKTSALLFARVMIAFVVYVSANAAHDHLNANVLIVMDSFVYVVSSLDPLSYYVTQEKLRDAFVEMMPCNQEEEEEPRPDSQADVVPDLVSEVGIIKGRNRAFSMAAATHGVRPSFY